MSSVGTAWTSGAREPGGDGFAQFHAGLTEYNAARFRPGLPEEAPLDELERDQAVARAEIELIESLLRTIAPLVADMPADVDAFIAWFERLKDMGPGQGDPLFPLARHDGHAPSRCAGSCRRRSRAKPASKICSR